MIQNEANLSELLLKIRRRLDDASRSTHTEKSGPPIACVFDIDSTLFCVSTRTRAILQALAKEESFKSRFPNYAKQLENIEVRKTDWGIKDPLVRLGMNYSDEVIKEIKTFWRKNFFSNDFLSHDLLYEDANLFVSELKKLNCEIFYLTGRSESLMREGTLKQLSQYSFPLTKSEHLIMKKGEDEQDEDFKLNKLREIILDFKEVYFFENEPVIIHSVNEHLPEVKIIFMDSTHSSKGESPTHLPMINPDSYKRLREKK